MFPDPSPLPWYTQAALWGLFSLLALLLWGVASAGRSLLCGRLLRTLLHVPTALRSPWCTLGGQLGTAHWATRREVARAGLLTPGSVPLGLYDGQTLYEPKGAHAVVFGPPRSGKSWGVVMPVLRQWPGS